MDYGYDTFESEIPDDVLMMLYELGKELDIDPLSSIESEEYFCKLLSDYSGEQEGLREYFQKIIQTDFQVVKEKPVWIQGSEWPFYQGKPMTFIGQIDPVHFMGDTSFYVFYDKESGTTKTIVQCD